MLKISFEELVQKIKDSSGLEEEEIRGRVDEKVSRLSGLVSREGAAHILANELGIKLEQEAPSGRLQIKNVLPGMRNVDITAKVISVYPAKSFQKDGREGKIASLLVADETGQTRIAMWNEHAEKAANISPGDIVKVKGGYSKQRNGANEVHLGDKAQLAINPEGETVNVEITPANYEKARKQLAELQGTESNVEVLATIVQVFEPRYFEICQCGKRARQTEKGATCETHGAVKPAYSYVLNAFIDDGTDNIRAVFFREQAKRLLNKSNEEILTYKDEPMLFEPVRNELLGTSVKLTGRATKNELYDRIELIANNVILNPDPEPEIKRLEEELEQLRQNSEEKV
ncbi:DUF2240 family protein [Candidatus Woesearchaeota archaeon]|nr:DUF2240 family protein [Candidatus Woesearchaeota archaeon]